MDLFGEEDCKWEIKMAEREGFEPSVPAIGTAP